MVYVKRFWLFDFYIGYICTLLSIISRFQKKSFFFKNTDCTNAINHAFVTNMIVFINW